MTIMIVVVFLSLLRCLDMGSGSYVPLDSRVKGACRCEKCSSIPAVRRWYENDLVCKSDGDLCYNNGECFSKRRVYVGHVKRKPKYRLRVVKCPRYVDGSLVASEHRRNEERNEPNGIG